MDRMFYSKTPTSRDDQHSCVPETPRLMSSKAETSLWHGEDAESPQKQMDDPPTSPELSRGSNALPETGHTQELVRNFSLWSLAGNGLLVCNTWPALGGSILVAIYNGGPPGVVYEFIVASAFYCMIAASLAELASAMPSSAGPYLWASITPGKTYGRSIGFFAGWWNALAWVFAAASISAIGGMMLRCGCQCYEIVLTLLYSKHRRPNVRRKQPFLHRQKLARLCDVPHRSLGKLCRCVPLQQLHAKIEQIRNLHNARRSSHNHYGLCPDAFYPRRTRTLQQQDCLVGLDCRYRLSIWIRLPSRIVEWIICYGHT